MEQDGRGAGGGRAEKAEVGEEHVCLFRHESNPVGTYGRGSDQSPVR